ncbi:Ribonuclease H-like domain [Trinorchestia longiramus]|nr:Ribonuclease H-like domain [Trinorchestia longiramus]
MCYKVSASCRKTTGSKPGHEHELFLVVSSCRELARIGKAATVVEWYAARVLYRVSACAERLRAGSKPGNEYELFLVSRRELALIDIDESAIEDEQDGEWKTTRNSRKRKEKPVEESEIQEGGKKMQTVQKVMRKRPYDNLCPSKVNRNPSFDRADASTIKLGFAGTQCPSHMYVGFTRYAVFPFNAPPRRFQRLGHVAVNCGSPLRCLVCSGPHTKDECTAEPGQEKCANCHQTHIASSKECPAIRNAAAIQELQHSEVGFEAAQYKVYIAFIRSKLEYGWPAWEMLRSSSLKKLAVIQNMALRNILGVRKTSPVLALEVESRIPPLELRLQLLTARWYIHLMNRGNHDYTLKQLGLARRRQQTVFETQARQVLVSRKLLIPRRVRTGTLSPVPPWSNFPNFISVDAPCRTAYYGQEAANEAIMQDNLNAKYSGFMQIFTDGSKRSSGSTAAALFVPSLAQAVGWKLNAAHTILGAKLFGIHQALIFANKHPALHNKDIVILSDSQSALHLLKNIWNPNYCYMCMISRSWHLKDSKYPKYASNGRLRLGHVGVAVHLHCFQLLESPLCRCGQVETVEHFLLNCDNYSAQRHPLKRLLQCLGLQFNLKNVLGGGDYSSGVQLRIISLSPVPVDCGKVGGSLKKKKGIAQTPLLS